MNVVYRKLVSASRAALEHFCFGFSFGGRLPALQKDLAPLLVRFTFHVTVTFDWGNVCFGCPCVTRQTQNCYNLGLLARSSGQLRRF